MQIIRDIEQGSDEWLKLRLGVATASNFDKIITTTGKESEEEKITEVKKKDPQILKKIEIQQIKPNC